MKKIIILIAVLFFTVNIIAYEKDLILSIADYLAAFENAHIEKIIEKQYSRKDFKQLKKQIEKEKIDSNILNKKLIYDKLSNEFEKKGVIARCSVKEIKAIKEGFVYVVKINVRWPHAYSVTIKREDIYYRSYTEKEEEKEIYFIKVDNKWKILEDKKVLLNYLDGKQFLKKEIQKPLYLNENQQNHLNEIKTYNPKYKANKSEIGKFCYEYFAITKVLKPQEVLNYYDTILFKVGLESEDVKIWDKLLGKWHQDTFYEKGEFQDIPPYYYQRETWKNPKIEWRPLTKEEFKEVDTYLSKGVIETLEVNKKGVLVVWFKEPFPKGKYVSDFDIHVWKALKKVYDTKIILIETKEGFKVIGYWILHIY